MLYNADGSALEPGRWEKQGLDEHRIKFEFPQMVGDVDSGVDLMVWSCIDQMGRPVTSYVVAPREGKSELGYKSPVGLIVEGGNPAVLKQSLFDYVKPMEAANVQTYSTLANALNTGTK